MRTAARKDRPQVAIVQALRQHGVRVVVLNQPGLPDLLCDDPQSQALYLIEVKASTGRFTRRQKTCPVRFSVCRTTDDALTDLAARRWAAVVARRWVGTV